MNSLIEEIIEANRNYSQNFGEKAGLSMPPRKGLALLTCMDARLDPLRFSGMELGDAHVIRNAGGRATEDAIRSLVISHKLLGTNVWMVIHHTDCGMETFTNEVMGDLLAKSLETARFDGEKWVDEGKGPGSEEGRKIDWLPISDQQESVCDDVERIRTHPLVSSAVSVNGYLFDVKKGLIIEIV